MVDIILQKGKDAFDLFVKALLSEHHHIGHKSLAETLQKFGYEAILASFKFGGWMKNRQTAKLKSPPNILRIRYI